MEMEQKMEDGYHEFTLELGSDSEIEMEAETKSNAEIKAHSVLVGEIEAQKIVSQENKNCVSLLGSKVESKEPDPCDDESLKWSSREEVCLLSAILDGIHSGRHGVGSVVDAVSTKACPAFWDDTTDKLMTETDKCVLPIIAYQKFRYMSVKFFARRKHSDSWNAKEREVFPLLDKIFSSVGKENAGLDSENEQNVSKGEENEITSPNLRGRLRWASNLSDSRLCPDCISKDANIGGSAKNTEAILQDDSINCPTPQANVKEANERETSDTKSNKTSVIDDFSSNAVPVKRLNWDLQAQILMASAVLDSLKSVSHGITNPKEVTCYRTFRGFWDNVAISMKEKTGKFASSHKYCGKFRSLRTYFLDKKGRGSQTSHHERELLEILGKIFDGDSGLYSKQKIPSTRSPRSQCHELRNLYKRRKLRQSNDVIQMRGSPTVENNANDAIQMGSSPTGEKDRSDVIQMGGSPTGEKDTNDVIQMGSSPNGEDDTNDAVQLGSTPAGEKVGNAAEGNENNQHVFHTTRQSTKKIRWALKDEILLVNAVKEGFFSGIDNVTSLRDLLSFRRHEGFWNEIKKKLNGLISQPVATFKLYTKFYNMRNSYISGRSIRRKYDEHDTQIHIILDQIHKKQQQKQTGDIGMSKKEVIYQGTIEKSLKQDQGTGLHGNDQLHTENFVQGAGHPAVDSSEMRSSSSFKEADPFVKGTRGLEDMAVSTDELRVLERKLRKSRLMQELHKIEQEELEDQIRIAKSKACTGSS